MSHSELLNAENLYECPECRKCFPKYVSLYKHRRIHTGERPYRCETCGRCFVQKIHLTVHRRTHTGERPFECDKCDKKFAKKHHLTNHMHVHTDIKSYSCDLCDKYFKWNSELKTHRRTHFEDGDCDACHQVYTYRTPDPEDRPYVQLQPPKLPIPKRQDIPVQLPQRPQKELTKLGNPKRKRKQQICPHCGDKMYDRYALKRHILKKHNGDFAGTSNKLNPSTLNIGSSNSSSDDDSD